jgi:hypothetical protein
MNGYSRPRRPSNVNDDPYVRKLYRFESAWDRLGDNGSTHYCEGPRVRLHSEGDIYWAYVAFAVEECIHTRDNIEAWLLTDLSYQKIATKTKMSVSAIRWYEKLFFNVRDRRDTPNYIAAQVIGPVVGEGLEAVELGTLKKFFGYNGGPAVLDSYINECDRSIARPREGESTGKFINKFFETSMGVRAATAVQTFEINKFNVMQVFELNMRQLEGTAKEEAASGQITPIEENIGMMLSAVNWAVGTSREELLVNSPLKPYLGGTGEPRVEEMYSLLEGGKPDSLGDIEGATFPEPEDKNEDTKQSDGAEGLGLH